MTRLTMGLLVAAAASALGWWSSARNGGSTLTATLAQNANQAANDNDMIKTPGADVDPNMIRQMPDVDPNMIRRPPWPRGSATDTPPNGRIDIKDQANDQPS